MRESEDSTLDLKHHISDRLRQCTKYKNGTVDFDSFSHRNTYVDPK
jgi:hypothetical protein